jgi:hypothetical protein
MKKSKLEYTLQLIVDELNAGDWSSDTPANIADILTNAGYEITDNEG